MHPLDASWCRGPRKSPMQCIYMVDAANKKRKP